MSLQLNRISRGFCQKKYDDENNTTHRIVIAIVFLMGSIQNRFRLGFPGIASYRISFYHPPPMSQTLRQQARRSGQRFYSPVEPCCNGHVAPRYVSSGHCTECAKDRREADRQLAHAAARASGTGSKLFTYPLHPDDHAAALAFCQALDLQRGRIPQQGVRDLTPPKAAAFAADKPVALPAWLLEAREQVGADLGAGHEAHRADGPLGKRQR